MICVIAHTQSNVRYNPRMPDGQDIAVRPAPITDHAALIDRIASGEYVPALAREYGVTKQALSARLRRIAPEAYAEAREIAAEIRLEDAQMAIAAAEDNIDLARARELFRAVAWRAEREHPSRWGTRPNTAIQVSGDGLQVQIVSYSSNNAPQHA